jgi:predicted nucleic acid-binding Zn ribbon protein
MTGRSAESVGKILSHLLTDVSWGRRVAEARVLTLWEDVVGETLGKHTRPLRVREGRMVVAVEDPIWKQEIALLRGEIIRNLNRRMGRDVVRDIVLVVH